ATASATATAGKNGSIQAGSSVTGFVFPLAIADGNASYYQYVTIGGGSLDNIFRIMLSSPVTIGITGTGTAEADLSVGPADSPVSPTVVRTSFATDPGTFAL